MSVRVPVNPDVVEWALQRSASPEKAFDKYKDLTAWISGETMPTWPQLQGFANLTNTPFGTFFLNEVPKISLPTQDFRDGVDRGFGRVSNELLDVLNYSARRHNWYVEYAESQGMGEIAIVSSASEWDPTTTASDMRKKLVFEVTERPRDRHAARRHLIQMFERLGGLVSVNSMVGDNTNRPLDPSEFRGFSLVDEKAPLVFVNSSKRFQPRQTLSAQLFTLAHEFAHVWKGSGGIGNYGGIDPPQHAIEQWCNAVATEFLVPQYDLLEVDKIQPYTPQVLDQLAARYHASTFVVLYALRGAGRVSDEQFRVLYQSETARISRLLLGAENHKNDGGNPHFSRRYRIGESLTRAVSRELAAGRLSPREALSLTGIKTMKSFDNYINAVGT